MCRAYLFVPICMIYRYICMSIYLSYNKYRSFNVFIILLLLSLSTAGAEFRCTGRRNGRVSVVCHSSLWGPITFFSSAGHPTRVRDTFFACRRRSFSTHITHYRPFSALRRPRRIIGPLRHRNTDHRSSRSNRLAGRLGYCNQILSVQVTGTCTMVAMTLIRCETRLCKSYIVVNLLWWTNDRLAGLPHKNQRRDTIITSMLVRYI